MDITIYANRLGGGVITARKELTLNNMKTLIDKEYQKMKDQMSLPIMPIIMTKNLSQLQNEAMERFEKLKNGEMTRVECEGVGDNNGFYEIKKKQVTWNDVEDFLKIELTQIVKESFKNTRVEERDKTYARALSMEWVIDGYNDALIDKHNKQNYFLNN